MGNCYASIHSSTRSLPIKRMRITRYPEEIFPLYYMYSNETVVIFNIFNYTTMSESVCLVCQSLNIYIALFFEITRRITAKICFLCTTCIVMQYIFIYYIIFKYLTTQRFQRPVSTTFPIPVLYLSCSLSISSLVFQSVSLNVYFVLSSTC